jgi:hypothetical protein
MPKTGVCDTMNMTDIKDLVITVERLAATRALTRWAHEAIREHEVIDKKLKEEARLAEGAQNGTEEELRNLINRLTKPNA